LVLGLLPEKTFVVIVSLGDYFLSSLILLILVIPEFIHLLKIFHFLVRGNKFLISNFIVFFLVVFFINLLSVNLIHFYFLAFTLSNGA
jgi:hypothetical protein